MEGLELSLTLMWDKACLNVAHVRSCYRESKQTLSFTTIFYPLRFRISLTTFLCPLFLLRPQVMVDFSLLSSHWSALLSSASDWPLPGYANRFPSLQGCYILRIKFLWKILSLIKIDIIWRTLNILHKDAFYIIFTLHLNFIRVKLGGFIWRNEDG